MIKKPSAWIPIVLSLIVLVAMLITIAVSGIPAQQPEDEGIGAHLFQIWLMLEVFLLAFFAIKWLPRAPKQTLFILAIQIVAALLPMSIVFSLKL